jgi:hypothetical protein
MLRIERNRNLLFAVEGMVQENIITFKNFSEKLIS